MEPPPGSGNRTPKLPRAPFLPAPVGGHGAHETHYRLLLFVKGALLFHVHPLVFPTVVTVTRAVPCVRPRFLMPTGCFHLMSPRGPFPMPPLRLTASPLGAHLAVGFVGRGGRGPALADNTKQFPEVLPEWATAAVPPGPVASCSG